MSDEYAWHLLQASLIQGGALFDALDHVHPSFIEK
jgi:hypothetical protein